MGLFDGRGATTERLDRARRRGCSARPWCWSSTPSSQSRSVAALVHGFATYDPAVRLAGVVLNRVGSDRHEQVLREALDGVAPVLGVLRRDAAVATPEPAPRAGARRPSARRRRWRPSRRLGELCRAALRPRRDARALARTAPAAGAVRRGRRRCVERAERPVVAVAGGRRSRSPTPRPPSCSPPPAPRSCVVDPLRDERAARAAPPAWSSRRLPRGLRRAAVGQRGAARRRRAARRAAARPSAPSAPGCSTLPAARRRCRCAACCRAAAEMTPRLTLGYRDAGRRRRAWLAGGPVAATSSTARSWSRAPASRPAWRRTAAEGFVQAGVHASLPAPALGRRARRSRDRFVARGTAAVAAACG